MNKWNIYHKDGSVLTDANDEQITVHGLDYSDSWMGECFVTISFKNNAPIDFKIGDYIEYRGERFELNYDPGKEKQARKNSYGEAFVYDSVKFNALQDELTRTEFLDVVLNDNELHYTALPKFSFYVETLDDLLDRLQANLNEQIGEGKWKIFSRNLDRSEQRGCTEEEWNEAYGEGTKDITIDTKSITIDTKTCWEALALVNSEWDVNFIVRGRNVYVGTAGVPTANIFKYGLGKGLYQVNQNADSGQSIITRLRAYGSEKNLPSHYYADLGTKYKCNITKVITADNEKYHYVNLLLDLDYDETYFNTQRTYTVGGHTTTYGWVLQVTFDYKTIITGYVRASEDKKCVFYSEVAKGSDDTGDEPSQANLDAFVAQVKAGNTVLYMSSGVNKSYLPSSCKEYAENLPNNMAINRLMLPGFPHLSLKEYYDALSDTDKAYVNPNGKEYRFSEDKYRPYIDSPNIDEIGLRSGSQFFDTDDKTNGVIEIYPTLEEMEIGGVRVDEINGGVAPDDDGRFDDGQTVANVDIYLSPYIDFDITGLKNDDFAISMKDGMCGGRTFNVASTNKVNGRWRLTIERVKDDALELYFPYRDYPIKKGDHFVLTGIELPDSYVTAASLKLLKYALALLDKNDYTRYVYQPKVDEIFMARQHDTALADETGTTKSLHDTLKAGDIMLFEDDDLNIDAQISIDQLSIKEEDGKIPTYEITLREDKEVGTIQKIKQQISSLESGNGGSGGGATTAQVKSIVASEGTKYFLSKLYDDVAQGFITLKEGFAVGADKLWGIAKDGVATVKNLFVNGDMSVEGDTTMQGDATILGTVTVDRVHDRNSTEADRTIVGAQGFDLYMGADGKSHLYVDYLTARTKFFASQAEIRKVSYSGGTTLFSNAGSQIAKVAYVYDAEGKNVIAYKCYAAADDGTTQTANWWHVGMMALCQTFNVKAGQTTTDLQNRYYWRLVVGVGQEVLDDGKLYDYVVLSNVKQFQGNTKNVPVYADAVLADDGTLLEWGNVLLAITTAGGSDSLANIFSSQEGRTTDDGGTEVASRIFYGYEPKEDGSEPDAPLPYDVIVQAGDQIRWQSYGNVIKLETSTEDNASDTAPAITMYHKMGAPYGTGSYDESGTEIVNPYQWLTVTALLSPVEVRFNADYYKLFQGTPDNIIDPIVVMHEVVPSTMCLVRDQQTQSCTPSNITFTIRKRTGGKVETMTDTNVKWYASVNGATETLAKTGASITLSEIATPYNVTRLHMRAVLDDEQLAVYDLPVVSNGTNGNDGTSVTIKGKCAAHYANYAAIGTYGGETNDCVLVDSSADFPADKCSADSTFAAAPSVAVYVSAPDWDWRVWQVETGDGYLSADGDLWVAGDSAWTNAGHIKGDQGDQGDPGTDAVDFVVSGTPLVFDTDDSGLIPASDSKTATLQAWQGGKNVTAQLVMAGTADENVSKWAYSGIGTDTVSATIYKVKTQTIDGDSVSCTSGFVMMTFTYNGVSYPVSIPFSVNVSKFNHTVYSTAKESIDKYTEVSTDVKTAQQTADDAKTAAGKAQTTADGAQSSADKAQTSADNAQSAADQAQADADTANNAIADIPIKTPAQLTQYTSEIKQTAREISLEVQSETVGRRNMLTGSGLTKQDGWSYMSGGALCSERPAERIEIASGMDGTPAMRCRTVQTAASSYVLAGMHWVGNSPQGNVRIEKGKTYVLSFWGKAVDKDAVEFVAEAIWQGSLTDTSRPAGYKGPVNFSTAFTPTASGAWERHEVVLTVPATASYDYVEVCLFARAKGYTVTEAYLCRPMLEEAAAYNGWTLSEHDYDYVGGNMLDNTASLLVGDNLKLQNGTRIDGGYDGDTTYVLATIDSTADDKYTEVLQWSTEDMGITALSDYVLSFVAKGSGELHTYLYPSTAYNHSENSQNGVQDSTDGQSIITLTQEWRRYWVHWKPQTAVQTSVLMRLMRPTGGTSTLYIAQPKMERGAVRTAWTERKTDLIDRQTLRQAGISITSDTVELYGDQIKVSETKGGTPTAMFSGGKLSASLIDAETIVVNGLQGKTIDAENATIKNLNVTGEINATGGTVGGFTIEKSQMTGQGEEGNVNMTLCPSYVHYVDSSMGIDASFGALKSLFDNSVTYCAWMTSEKNWPTKLVGPYGNYTEQQLNIGLYVSASGTMHKLSRDSTLNYHNGNHAILCPKGDYAGFRPYMRRIIGSQTLSPYDVMLEVVETYTAHDDAKDTDTTYTVGAVTLTLPTDPELGQLYWILRPTKYDTTVKTTDGSKIAYPTGVGTEVTLKTQNEMVWIVWTGEYWRMMWRMGVA